MCKTIVITTTKEANQMLEILEGQHIAAQKDDYASERAKRVKMMTCTCCGNSYRGRQWWNQDCGYGLGDCCVQYCGVDPAAGEDVSYGVPGIHFLIQQHTDLEAAQALGFESIVADKIRRFIRVHYDSGNTVDTEIIGTKDDILRYYVGNEFNLGDGAGGDLMAKALRVEFL